MYPRRRRIQISSRQFGRWLCTGLAAAAVAFFAPATSVGASSAKQGGLYVALGDSISGGLGASSPTESWVQLYYGYLQSRGRVADLYTLALNGGTSADLRARLHFALDAIRAKSDTKVVTIDIGINDIHGGGGLACLRSASEPGCRFAANFGAILKTVNKALASDPGDEVVQVMEYYNAGIGTPNAGEQRKELLGTDGKIDCSATGTALGLNDLIHCISIEQGATPIDTLPIFGKAGKVLIAGDHEHPNDAGHRAIAKAFGGAARPTTPPAPLVIVHADSVGTLQVSSLFVVKFDRADCPAGTPATTACHPNVSGGAILWPGLGKVTNAPYTLVLDDFATACTRVHAQIPLVVAGKGEIDLAMPSSGCITPAQLVGQWPPVGVTVSGGSGRYAGASGSGVLTISSTVSGPESGHSIWTWTGTLNVAGLTFDTTPPQIAGATSMTVKTRAAIGARVRYAVKVADATDGQVPAVCAPKSGGLFRVGRTTVDCTAGDSSGNTTATHFVIAVKRIRG